jgi:hypothetical protein
MDIKTVLNSTKLFCSRVKRKVDLTISRGACAMRNRCADSEHCPLYVERLIKEAKKNGENT